jgi:hypothetical protein
VHSICTIAYPHNVLVLTSQSGVLLSSLRSGTTLAITEAFEVRKIKCADGWFVVAKSARTLSESTLQSLRRQFAALHALQSLPIQLRQSVPEPRFFNEENGTLVMSLLKGASLNSILRWRGNALAGAFSRPRLRSIGYSVGNWLSRFQAATLSESHRHVHHEFLNRLERNFAGCDGPGLSGEVLRRVRDRAEQLSANLNGSSICTAGSHGEFLPQNILVQGTSIGVVDFDTYSLQTSIYDDLAKFLTYLRLLAGKPQYSRNAVLEVIQGFGEGYGNNFNVQLLRLNQLNAIFEIMSDKRVRPLRARSRRRLEHVLLATLG